MKFNMNFLMHEFAEFGFFFGVILLHMFQKHLHCKATEQLQETK